jgi:hypothetical protein
VMPDLNVSRFRMPVYLNLPRGNAVEAKVLNDNFFQELIHIFFEF